MTETTFQHVQTKSPSRKAQTVSRPWLTLLVVLSEAFLSILDFFIVNVSIPSMQNDLGASAADIQLVIAGFGLAFGAGMITSGRLGDRYGRRLMFCLGLGGFAITSLACSMAPDASELIFARVAQGLAASMMTPQVLAILSTVFEGQARAKALGAYATTMGLAAVSGQLIGGLLIDLNLFDLGWRLCFLINVPIALLALAFAKQAIPKTPPQDSEGLDIYGAILATSCVVTLVLPLIEGREQGWPEWTWLSLILTPLLTATFVISQHRKAVAGRAVLIDLTMFQNRSFSIGNVLAVTISMGQGSFFLLLALYLQQGHALSALDAGLFITPMAVAYVIASASTEKLSGKLDRQVIALGAAIMAVSLVVCSELVSIIGDHASVWWLVPVLITDGVGMGFVFSSLTPTVMARVPKTQAGVASGVLTTAMQTGGAIGIAVVGAVFFEMQSRRGISHAFGVSLEVLAVTSLLTAGLTQLLPRRH